MLWRSRGQGAMDHVPSRPGRDVEAGHLALATQPSRQRRALDRLTGSEFGDATAYLLRGTKAWPLTPKPPSGVSKICTKSFLAGSGGCFVAPSTTSVMPFIMALFCSRVRTPAGT